MDRPLRFCMITTFYPPYNFGGDGIFVRQLSNELACRGHHVDVIHCIDAYQSLSHQEHQAGYNDHPNVTVHGLKTPFGPLSPLASQQTGTPAFKSTRIRRILEKGFDVIHYHNVSLVGGPKILAYGQGIKLYTMHEYWLICPTHMLFKFNRAPCTTRHCFLCGLSYKRPPQWWRYLGLLKSAVKHVDAFIAPSRFIKELHRAELNIPIVHLPNFVPSSENNTAPLSDRSAGEQPYFLFVGRLESLKGLQTIIPLFRRYRKAQLWVAGTGNYEPHLRRLAGGSASIRFLGYRSGEELNALYRNAVAAIVPSLYYENFPLVTIEAFRQRTPVIVRNLGGLPEIVTDSGGGFVFDSDQELETAMDQVLTDPSCRRDMGLNGYQAYKRNWTAESHLQGYFGLIHKIAGTGSPTPRVNL
jgi:glycosyltransferase involved in cell wall biosynthesis